MANSHLRLIQGGASIGEHGLPPVIPEKKAVVRRPRAAQLKFPFAEERIDLRVIIVIMDMVHGRAFNDLLGHLRPEVVLDLRHAVRFDLPGTNRQTVFNQISNINALYAVELLPWHQMQAKDMMAMEWGLSPRLLHELMSSKESRVMLLVSKLDHARMLSPYINRVLSRRPPASWELELFG